MAGTSLTQTTKQFLNQGGIMADGLANNGHEQYGQFDWKRVSEGGELDHNEVYIIPGGRRDGYADVKFSMSIAWRDEMDYLIEKAGLWPDRGYFIREAIAIRMNHYSVYLPVNHPQQISAKIQSDKLKRQAMAEDIQDIKAAIVSGNQDPDEARERLMALMDYCKQRSWRGYIETIRTILTQMPLVVTDDRLE